jgi:hypothetical protein
MTLSLKLGIVGFGKIARDEHVPAIAHPEGETALSFEYRALYARFLDLVRSGRSDVDLAPLQLVADAFLAGRIDIVQPFDQ